MAQGSRSPVGLAFLPDGRMLVTEKPGRLRIVAKDGTSSQSHCRRAEGGRARPRRAARRGARSGVRRERPRLSLLFGARRRRRGHRGRARAAWRGAASTTSKVIFRQQPKVSGGNHFGSRLAFSPDGKLFVTLGDRFKVRSGAGPRQPSRQDRAHQSRRLGARGQSLRRPGGHAARDLVVRPSQPARRGDPSGDRQSVGDGVRTGGRRRAEHPGGRQELRLAAGELGQAL